MYTICEQGSSNATVLSVIVEDKKQDIIIMNCKLSPFPEESKYSGHRRELQSWQASESNAIRLVICPYMENLIRRVATVC